MPPPFEPILAPVMCGTKCHKYVNEAIEAKLPHGTRTNQGKYNVLAPVHAHVLWPDRKQLNSVATNRHF